MTFDACSQINAVCPYCGYEDPDSWDLGWGFSEDEGVTECPLCEKDYKWYVWTEYRYTTKKVGETND